MWAETTRTHSRNDTDSTPPYLFGARRMHPFIHLTPSIRCALSGVEQIPWGDLGGDLGEYLFDTYEGVFK